MWQFIDIEDMAESLFSPQETISRLEFRKARGHYFYRVRRMDSYTKNKYFNSTYYSGNNQCWFLYGGYRYFYLTFNAGSIDSSEYYGKQQFNINL